MRRFALVVALASLLAINPRAAAQIGPEPAPTVSSAHAIAFDVAGVNVDGQPTSIESADLTLIAPDGTSAGRVEIPAEPGKVTVPLTGLLAGIKSGAYTVTARVKGTNGLWSAPSSPLAIQVDNVAPAAPTNLTIEIIVRVSVSTP